VSGKENKGKENKGVRLGFIEYPSVNTILAPSVILAVWFRLIPTAEAFSHASGSTP